MISIDLCSVHSLELANVIFLYLLQRSSSNGLPPGFILNCSYIAWYIWNEIKGADSHFGIYAMCAIWAFICGRLICWWWGNWTLECHNICDVTQIAISGWFPLISWLCNRAAWGNRLDNRCNWDLNGNTLKFGGWKPMVNICQFIFSNGFS